jgi:hypothetical protein
VNTFFVLRYARAYKQGGYVPLAKDETPHYLYKIVRRNKYDRSPSWSITHHLPSAKTWRTRAGAEKYLRENLTGYLGSPFDVEEIS